jgi:sugar phosphate isomerase/epimerase
MRFCVRHSIDFANSSGRLSKAQGVPIELAFPQELDEFLKGKDRLTDVARQVKEHQVPVYSVHAPEGPLADAAFLEWAGEVVQFGEAVGAGIVVLQPEAADAGTAGKDFQMVLENIRSLQARSRLTLAVETLRDRPRVLSPDEIMQHQLPLVLDTSQLPKSEITWVVETYHSHVVNLHLSAVIRDKEFEGIERKHQPIDRDGFCLDVLDRLQELGWNGVVTLEYMPWLFAKVVEDRMLLERIYGRQKR